MIPNGTFLPKNKIQNSNPRPKLHIVHNATKA